MTGTQPGWSHGTNAKDTTMADTVYHYDFARTEAAGFSGFMARLRQVFAQYRLFRQTVDELEKLNDRELADLGISRLQIGDIARESVYGYSR